jgi:N-methylhydantoinase A
MAEDARATLREEGVPDDRIAIAYAVDLRYIGQFNEVEVPARNGDEGTAEALDEMVAAFHARHDTLYGYSMRGAPVELINLRVSARGVTDKPQFSTVEAGGEDPGAAKRGERRAYFEGEFVDVPVYDALRLANGNVVSGPAIVDQPTTTIVVPPGFDLVCDHYNNFLMHPRGASVDELRTQLVPEEARLVTAERS